MAKTRTKYVKNVIGISKNLPKGLIYTMLELLDDQACLDVAKEDIYKDEKFSNQNYIIFGNIESYFSAVNDESIARKYNMTNFYWRIVKVKANQN